jgi:predicted peroxiredoxin
VAEKLGIFISSNKNLRHVIGICKAAEAAGKEVTLFFSHKGVLLTQEPEFKELIHCGKKSLCHVGFEANKLTGKPVPGMTEKDFTSQMYNVEMVEQMDRYIVM